MAEPGWFKVTKKKKKKDAELVDETGLTIEEPDKPVDYDTAPGWFKVSAPEYKAYFDWEIQQKEESVKAEEEQRRQEEEKRNKPTLLNKVKGAVSNILGGDKKKEDLSTLPPEERMRRLKEQAVQRGQEGASRELDSGKNLEYLRRVIAPGLVRTVGSTISGIGSALDAVVDATSAKMLKGENQLPILQSSIEFLQKDIDAGVQTRASLFGSKQVPLTKEQLTKKKVQLGQLMKRVDDIKNEQLNGKPNIGERLREKGLQIQKKGGEMVTEVQKDIGQPKKWTGTWLASEVLTNGPSFLATFGLGAGTFLVTKNPAAAVAVGFPASFVQESGAAYADARNSGLSDKEAQKVGVTTGTINATIEQMPLGNYLSKATAGTQLRKSIMANVSNYLVAKAKQGGVESITESVQQIVSNVVAQTYDEQRELFEGVPESGTVGFLLSMVVPVGGSSKVAIQEGVSDPVATSNKITEEAILTAPENRTPEQQQIVDSIEEMRIEEEKGVSTDVPTQEEEVLNTEALDYVKSKKTKLRQSRADKLQKAEDSIEYVNELQATFRKYDSLSHEEQLQALDDLDFFVKDRNIDSKIRKEAPKRHIDTQTKLDLINKYGFEQLEVVKELESAGFKTIRNKKGQFGGREKLRLKDDFKEFTGVEMTDDQESAVIALNERLFGDTDIRVVGQIIAHKDALGSYRDGIIKVVSGQADIKDTFYHEAVHKYLDVFTSEDEYASILMEAKDRYGLDNFEQTEEQLAEDFISYAKSREGATGKLKLYFDKIITRIKAYLGNVDELDMVYQDILGGKKTAEAVSSTSAQETIVRPGPATKALQESLEARNKDIFEAGATAETIEKIRAMYSDSEIKLINSFKSVMRSRAFQEGDIETLRNNGRGEIIENALETIKEKNPSITSEEDAIKFAQEFPTKASAKIQTALSPEERTLRIAALREVSKQEEPVTEVVTEVTPKEVSVPKEQLPVGTGKLKASRLEARMKGAMRNVSPEQAEALGISLYNQMNKEDTIAKAAAYVSSNEAEAIAVLRGESEAPAGIPPEALYVALTQVSKSDLTLATKLASLQATALGQRISLLSEIDPESPVTIMKDIIKVREEAFSKRNKGQSPAKEKSKVVKEIKQKAEVPSNAEWVSFVDSIKC